MFELLDTKQISVEDIKNKKLIEKMNSTTEKYIINGYPNIFSKIAEYYIQIGGKDKNQEQKNYVLIIDEINRGNISKIFGELITLIEESKRAGNEEAIEVALPYSGEKFSVPKNLYIIGTMNTADRSIALMDTALRRRFEFVEMMPDLSILSKDEQKIKNFDADNMQENDLMVQEINIRLLLRKINQRIEYLYDRDHTIGHAYFLSLKKIDNPEEAKNDLDNIFRNKIIPLLQEYFYDDWEKIQMVLGDHREQKANDEDKFVTSKDQKEKDIFGFDHEDIEDNQVIYNINKEFTKTAYTKIYQKANDE